MVVELNADVFGEVENIGVDFVDSVAFGLQVHEISIPFDDIFETVVDVALELAQGKVLTQVGAGKSDGSTGVFLFGISEEIGGVAELGFDLLFAVAVVIVGNERDHGAAGIARGDFESRTVIVEFVFRFPAHAIVLLPVGGLREVGESQILLLEFGELGCENHASGVAGPVPGIEAGVVFRKVGITAIAENALHKIEIGNEVARCEEANFHAFFLRDPGNSGADDGTQKKGDEDFGRSFTVAGERENHDVLRRVEGGLEESRKGFERNLFFVGGNRKSAFGNVEDAFGGATVGGRIVTHALVHAIGTQDGGFEDILVRRKGEHAADAVSFQNEGTRGNQRGSFAVAEDLGEVVVDCLIHRAKIVGKESGLFLKRSDERTSQVKERVVVFFPNNVMASCGQLQVHKLPEAFLLIGRGNCGAVFGKSDGVLEAL